jgi:hypothetical protein
MSLWDLTSLQKLLKDGWKEDAETLLGIKLHPEGERNPIEFAMDSKDMKIIRGVFIVLTRQTVANIMCIFIMFYNLRIAIRMIYTRPHVLAGWFCAIQAIACLIMMFACLATVFPSGANCRELIWICGICLTISPLCVGAVLLQKAYLVHDRNKWLLAIGIILILPQIYVWYAIWTIPSIMHPDYGCIAIYDACLPLIKRATGTPINVIFSVIFIRVVYQQYKRLGSKAWARLAREGIQTMCMVVAVNIFCMLGIFFGIMGPFSTHLAVVDCIATSVLLIRHCSSILNATSRYESL